MTDLEIFEDEITNAFSASLSGAFHDVYVCIKKLRRTYEGNPLHPRFRRTIRSLNVEMQQLEVLLRQYYIAKRLSPAIFDVDLPSGKDESLILINVSIPEAELVEFVKGRLETRLHKLEEKFDHLKQDIMSKAEIKTEKEYRAFVLEFKRVDYIIKTFYQKYGATRRWTDRVKKLIRLPSFRKLQAFVMGLMVLGVGSLMVGATFDTLLRYYTNDETLMVAMGAWFLAGIIGMVAMGVTDWDKEL